VIFGGVSADKTPDDARFCFLVGVFPEWLALTGGVRCLGRLHVAVAGASEFSRTHVKFVANVMIKLSMVPSSS
jgi:hypothetical protein